MHVRYDLSDIRAEKLERCFFLLFLVFFCTPYLLRCITGVQRVYRFELFIFTEWQSIKTHL